MILDPGSCIGCGVCVMICPAEAIAVTEGCSGPVAVMDRDLCFECGLCLRAARCPGSALHPERDLGWPRELRRILSDPLTLFEATRITGRGTEEMKTNDVTGRFAPGQYGLCVDVGRPIPGARMRDVERITRTLAGQGVTFARENPVTSLMPDPGNGRLTGEVLNERVLSCVVEGLILPGQLSAALSALRRIEDRLEAAFTVGLIARVEDAGQRRNVLARLADFGMEPVANAKTNVGLGRLRR